MSPPLLLFFFVKVYQLRSELRISPDKECLKIEFKALYVHRNKKLQVSTIFVYHKINRKNLVNDIFFIFLSRTQSF